mmetsp:Transcript_21949/g.41465  ORF Transcript_21949/g.41465 Transcript_21949/m.41465 type:complete len:85 (-) Transcript_21949:269-523(-)
MNHEHDHHHPRALTLTSLLRKYRIFITDIHNNNNTARGPLLTVRAQLSNLISARLLFSDLSHTSRPISQSTSWHFLSPLETAER